MSLGAHAVREKKYTPLTTEHTGGGRVTTGGERQALQEDGPSPQPALETLLPGLLKKRRKSYNPRGGAGRGRVLSRLYTTL